LNRSESDDDGNGRERYSAECRDHQVELLAVQRLIGITACSCVAPVA
jgi:hypothetical protein